MKIVALKKPGGLENLSLASAEPRDPGPGEIQVRIKASSLNYHDYLVVKGSLPTEDGRIPMSDGAGEVAAVGPGVSEFSPGDKVLSTFFPNWIAGQPSAASLAVIPGDTAHGYAAEYVTMPATAFTRAPAGYSAEEAATLTCAGLTAWRALMVEAKIKPGDWVLVQGTGGVSIFALQFAKTAGAKVIATSSSDAKLERLQALGADVLFNYRSEPDWGAKAKEATGGRGVDVVVEVGGPDTLAQSVTACRVGGHISLIGVLTGFNGNVPTAALMMSNIALKGITVGSRSEQEDMVRAVETSGLKPVIDRTFPLEEIAGAFEHQESQKHFGKICLAI